jgi:hypothetical protein
MIRLQLEDPGKLVQVGYTSGSRSGGEFGLARNLLRKSGDTTRAEQRNAVAAAYMWRHVQLLHPPHIADDIDGFHKEVCLPRLDGSWPSSEEPHGPISLPTSCAPLTIQEAAYGPGCFVFAEMYSRFAAFFAFSFLLPDLQFYLQGHPSRKAASRVRRLLDNSSRREQSTRGAFLYRRLCYLHPPGSGHLHCLEAHPLPQHELGIMGPLAQLWQEGCHQPSDEPAGNGYRDLIPDRSCLPEMAES